MKRRGMLNLLLTSIFRTEYQEVITMKLKEYVSYRRLFSRLGDDDKSKYAVVSYSDIRCMKILRQNIQKTHDLTASLGDLDL